MPQHFPNPFPPEHAAHKLYETLTTQRDGDSPLVPKRVYRAETTGAINAAPDLSYNIVALLHLLNDDLDAAHVLVQAHEDDMTANYVHQIVHRREGDLSNTRYWVAKTGNHPHYVELAPLVSPHGLAAWDANQVVTWATRGEHFVAGLNDAETQSLLTWCVRTGA